MNWKQPIPTNLVDYTNGDKFAATLLMVLISRVSNKENTAYINNVPISLHRGQCICGRFELARCFGMKKGEEGRVQRKLERLVNPLKLITKQKSRDCSIVTINSYDELIKMKTSDEQSINKRQSYNNRATDTNKSVKNAQIDESVEISDKERSEYDFNTERL